jgi:hypothetical protein
MSKSCYRAVVLTIGAAVIVCLTLSSASLVEAASPYPASTLDWERNVFFLAFPTKWLSAHGESFMVERGHFDSVGWDEWVAYEYAKVRNLYQAKLDIGERTEIEWFVGPHTINGKGSFDFLHRHLHWPILRRVSSED